MGRARPGKRQGIRNRGTSWACHSVSPDSNVALGGGARSGSTLQRRALGGLPRQEEIDDSGDEEVEGAERQDPPRLVDPETASCEVEGVHDLPGEPEIGRA